jgi:hypothetical protein
MNEVAGLSFKLAEGFQHKIVQRASVYCLYFAHKNVFYP